jgi:three-Cys-motif partner protein
MPRDGGYDWSGGEPPVIDAHSVAKHRMLDAYLRDYVRTLAQNPVSRGLRLTVVDGFAGGGLYRGESGGEHLGSPLLVIRAMEEAAAEEATRRRDGLDVRIRYVFVEKDAAAAAFLSRTLDERRPAMSPGSGYEVVCGSFDERADGILAAAKRHSPRSNRAIFVLDQYGWNQVPMPLLQRIFSEFKAPEVILTFSVDKFANHWQDTPAIRSAVRSFDPAIDFDRWQAAVRDGGGDWRATVQHLLHGHFAAAAGARHYTPFYVASSSSNLSYWLIHLSRHVRARDVMAGAHWALGNCMEHHGGPGLDMLGSARERLVMGFDPRKGEAGTLPSLFRFDDRARAETLAALRDELPRRIRELHPGGVSVLGLYAAEANGTPAATEHFRLAIGRLVEDGDLVVVDGDGAETRGTRIQDGTRVRASRSASLFQIRRPWGGV